MTQAGGPAALNGFLYQIIQHLDWLTDVTLSGSLRGDDSDNACLVLEPRTGGDARAELAGRYLVEQYKTRKGGTWSVSDIESVLKDLRKAVPANFPEHAVYRFVTDGRAGQLGPLFSFLHDIRSASHPADLDKLDARSFNGSFHGTNREYFDRLVEQTRSANSSPVQESGRIFHLLKQFEMEFEVAADRLAASIERRIRPYASDLGAERRIREHLVGMLMEKLSQGETRLSAQDIDAMLRHAGISPDRLRNAIRLAVSLNTVAQRRLQQIGYQSDLDVREPPVWNEDRAVLLIAGDSGSGKTWQLGRLLVSCGEAGLPAMLCRNGHSANEILGNAANDVWQGGLQETSQRTLPAVVAHLRELIPSGPSTRTTIALDNVRDVDLARDLVRQDWNAWGIRLVMTVPTSVMNALRTTDANSIQAYSVPDFTVDELDRLLRRRGRRWADLAPDQKRLLRKPVLAGLFLELQYDDILRAPHGEYEIFDRFWERITANGATGDEGMLMALALRELDGGAYPLPRPQWIDIGLDGAAASRLVAAGWLRVNEDGSAEFTHDRLLNWAAAKSLVNEFRRRRILPDELSARLLQTVSTTRDNRLRSLTYVPMDALWMLSAEEANEAVLDTIIAHFEDTRDFGSYGDQLYNHLLPTLGQRAVPLLTQRMRGIPGDSNASYRFSLIAKAFAALAIQDGVDLSGVVPRLLRGQSPDQHRVALAVLTAAPDPRHLDRVWEIHKGHANALDDDREGRFPDLYQNSFQAISSMIAMEPDWLRHRILNANSTSDPVHELAYQLSALDHPDATSIWEETGDTLIASVPVHKSRSVINCIGRFADQRKKDYVIAQLANSANMASGVALSVLAALDPLVAIDQLVAVRESERYLTRTWWLPTLLLKHPEITRRRVLDLAMQNPGGRRIVEMLFSDRPDDLDEETLRFVIRDLESELQNPPLEASAGNSFWPYRSLDFLGKIVRPDYLAILEAEAGGVLEKEILDVAIRRPRSGSNGRDLLIESCRRALALIGGEGLTQLLLHELASPHFWVRYSGLKWAPLRGDPALIERLGQIAEQTRLADRSDRESNANQEFCMAMKALAALGADAQLVAILESEVTAGVPVDIAWLRPETSPMPKAVTRSARLVLEDDASTAPELSRALLVAWASGDAELIPPVRSVLEKVVPSSELARYACDALRTLGDKSQDFARLAQRLLYTEEGRNSALNALLTMGSVGLPILAAWLEDPAIERRHDDEQSAIRALYADPDTRVDAVRFAADRCQRTRYFYDGLHDIAAEANNPTLRAQIFDKAFAGRSNTDHLIRAIQGLAKFDAPRAVEAVEYALREPVRPRVANQLCLLLTHINPEAAVQKLVALAIEQPDLRRPAVRALRRLDSTAVGRRLAEALAGEVSARKASAEVAGSIGDPALTALLRHVAAEDSHRDVRTAALNSLGQRRAEDNLHGAIGELKTLGVRQRWSRLLAILEAADVELVMSDGDPLSIYRILVEDAPPAFEYHANEVVRRRRG